MHDLPPFPGFREEAFDFLRQLKQHNERDWFKPRKEIYEDEVQWPLRCLVMEVAAEAGRRGLPLSADPKRAVFRIYRDTRFSKNKAPYKTHAAAVLSRSGNPKEIGGLYLHVAPGSSYVAAGFWRPENALLRQWRSRMASDPASFLAIRDALEAAGLELNHDDNALKRMPRGFEDHADDEIADYLRWKSFIVSRPLTEEELARHDVVDTVVGFAEDVRPLLEWGLPSEAETP